MGTVSGENERRKRMAKLPQDMIFHYHSDDGITIKVDAIPLVRCKDCKWSYDAIGGTFCSHGVCVDCVVDIDFFCADGERKDADRSD